MAVEITAVSEGSPAEKKRIKAGDSLLAINGRDVHDVLDYRFFIPDEKLTLTVSSGGRVRRVRLHKEPYEEIGLEFSSYLMDEQRSCKNKCIFCFIDQLPPGMRDTLYFKDDDSRLSFLFGNYITLTNLTEHEIRRIIDMHISPINISVHTTDPELRCRMMNNRFAGDCLKTIERFAAAGLTIQCQLVLVPGYNDGEQLDRTLRDLAALGSAVRSVAAVPVGLTKYREGLAPIRGFTKEEAVRVIAQLTAAGDAMLQERGSRVFYPSDEWYILAEQPVPAGDFYEDYPQIENGVGMLASLREDFAAALALEERVPIPGHYVVATGVAAAPYIRELMAELTARWPQVDVRVQAIRNDFFGEKITVSGLVTGGDLMRQLSGMSMDALLIPANMLRQEGDCFLDDVTPEQVAEALHTRVLPIAENDGGALLEAFFQEEQEG